MIMTISYPLLPFQKQIFSICHHYPDSCAYNIPAAIEVKGKLNYKYLLDSLFCLQQWHPELRLIVREIEGNYFQFLSKELKITQKNIEEKILKVSLSQEAKIPLGCLDKVLTRIILWKVSDHKCIIQITISHMIADRFSLSLIIQSLWKIYHSLAVGKVPGNYEDPLFFNYLKKTNKFLTPISSNSYLKSLEGLSRTDYLPLDYSREQKVDFSGENCSAVIDHEGYEAIKNYCKAYKSSPYVFFATILVSLLHRLTGYDDIAFATAVSTRSLKYLHTFGPLINTLIIRQMLSSSMITYQDLLLSLQKQVNEALKNVDTPFTQVLSQLRKEQEEGDHVPQCMFVYQGHDFEIIEDDKLSMRLFLVDNSSTKCDLTIYIFDSNNEFKIKFEYAKALFKAETMDVLLKDLILLSVKVAKEKDLKLSSSIRDTQNSLLRFYERGTQVFLGDHPILLDIFKINCEKFKGKRAVTYLSMSYNYEDLDLLSNNVAWNLHKKGIKLGDIIGVYTERNHELIPILMGIWKAGAVYLPLESSLPRARLTNILNTAQPRLILTNQNVEGDDDILNIQTVSFTDLFCNTENKNLSLLSYVSPLDKAYLIFTSGSTGKPKGVFINHLGIYNRIAWMQSELNVTPADNILHKTSLLFDVSMWELLLPFFCGSHLTIVEKNKNNDPEYLAKIIQEKKITITHFVPVFLDTSFEIFKKYNFKKIRHIVCSGDILKKSTIQNVYSLLSDDTILHNFYGPTEASIDVSSYKCPRENIERLTPIGKPIWNTQLYVWTEGEIINDPLRVGEILISGLCLSTGYCHEIKLTQEKFIDVILPSGVDRVYRTGDLGMWSSTGELLFLGRNDRQIKIRGIRIEAEEIENRLELHSKIDNAYVCKQIDENGLENLVTYLVLKRDTQCTNVELKNYLLAYFTLSVIPNKFVYLDNFPLSASGKIDVRALSYQQSLEKNLPSPSFIINKDSQESIQILQKIWQKVLSVSTVKPDDNYFNLGGDSIKSIQITSLAKEQGFSFSVSDFLKNPTIFELTKFRANGKKIKYTYKPFKLLAKKDRRLINDEKMEDAYPLSFLQKSLVYHSEMSSYYNIYVTTFKIKGTFRLKVWEKAIEKTAIYHPIMRTYFDIGTYSEPIQIILKNVPQIYNYIDFRNQYNREEKINEFIELEKSHAFDWEKAPLFRFFIHQLQEDLIQFTVSEPCLDGWSVSIICTEIFKYYESMMSNIPYTADTIKASFGSFIEQEKKILISSKYQKFWKNQLAKNIKTLLISSPEEHPLFRLEHRLSSLNTQNLLNYAHHHKVPIKSLLLALHCKLLSQLTQQSIITTGIMSNGRPESIHAEKIAGIFINVLPLTIDISSKSLIEISKELIKIEAELNKYRALPYAAIISKAGNNLFDTIFNFTNFYPYKDFADGQNLTILSMKGTDQTLFGVTFQFTLLPIENTLRLAIDFNHINRNDPHVFHIYKSAIDLLEKESLNFSHLMT